MAPTGEANPHSADVLGEWRDGWWNHDFLGMIAKRLDLSEVVHAVDVGCGLGHWSRTVLRYLHPSASIIGVDRETKWVEDATAISEGQGLGRMRFVQGTAEALPLPDGSADLVTCQTVLMHVADPERALVEMLRVLRPGGLLLASEPTNFASSFLRDSVTAAYDPARLGRMAEYQSYVWKGRIRLGEGDECIGDRLPMLLRELGLHSVAVAQNERMNPVLPPHTAAMTRAMGPFPELVRKRGWRFDSSTALRLYSAGGGPAGRFDELHGEFVQRADETVAQLEAGTYWSVMGHDHYLVSARSP